MSTDFKRFMACMGIFMSLILFVGINTFFLMHETVDTFERKRAHYASHINVETIKEACLGADCEINL